MIQEILNSYSLCLDHVRRLVVDLTDEQMVVQPGNIKNHPAWNLGHLIYSAQMIGGEIGIQPWLLSEWERLFKTGSIPVANQAIYPKKAELLEALTEAQNRLTHRLSEMNETDLAQPLPDVRYRNIFPSIGHAVLHILTIHTSYHVGQISAWRRAMNLNMVFAPSNS